MTAFNKTVRIGSKRSWGGRWYSVYCNIHYKEDGTLSITGTEGPLPNYGCMGCCGQIVDELHTIEKYAPHWNRALLDKFVAVWRKYHLNDVRAGTEEQEDIINTYGTKGMQYTDHCLLLKEFNMYEVKLPDGTVHTYGSKWLKRTVPEDVLTFLYSLPSTDRTPAWV